MLFKHTKKKLVPIEIKMSVNAGIQLNCRINSKKIMSLLGIGDA